MNTTKYQNKMFSVMGDSISTLQGYNPPGYAVFYDRYACVLSGVFLYGSTWWGQVIKALGGELLVNNSFSGSTVSKLPGCEIPSYACSDERCSGLDKSDITPDVIIIYMGTNDWGHGVPIKAEGKADEEDLSVFETAYKVMLRNIRKNYPIAEIWCLTISESVCSRDENYRFVRVRNGISIEEFNRTIRECAEAENCKAVDVYAQSNPFDTFDGLHPDASGMKTLSDSVIRAVEATLY